MMQLSSAYRPHQGLYTQRALDRSFVPAKGYFLERPSHGRRLATVCQSYINPYKTLGVEEDASEHQIKRAYRKMALKLHPDVNGSPGAQVEFLQVQTAYETLIARGRGKDVQDGDHASRDSWDFHDWYWKFSTSKRPQRGATAAPEMQPSSQDQVQAQLAGLKRKAAFRRTRSPPPQHAQRASSAVAPSSASAHASASGHAGAPSHSQAAHGYSADPAAAQAAPEPAAAFTAAASAPAEQVGADQAREALGSQFSHSRAAHTQPDLRPQETQAASAPQQAVQQAEQAQHVSNNSVPGPRHTSFAALRTSSVLRCARKFVHEARSRHDQAVRMRLDRLAGHFRVASLLDDSTHGMTCASGAYDDHMPHTGLWGASHGGQGMQPQAGPLQAERTERSPARSTVVLDREAGDSSDAESLEEVVIRLESHFNSPERPAVGDEPADSGCDSAVQQDTAGVSAQASSEPWWVEVVTDGSPSTIGAGSEAVSHVQSQLTGLKRRAALRRHGK